MNNSLELFGKFIIENLFDRGKLKFETIAKKEFSTNNQNHLQFRFEKISPENKRLVEEIIDSVLTTAIHDFLFAIEEENDLKQRIKINVNGNNIADLSDGLHGEVFLEDGWIKQYSKYYK